MKESKIIESIINQNNTLLKIQKFYENRNKLQNTIIMDFTEPASNFKNIDLLPSNIGKYNLCELADYTKTWIISKESNHDLKIPCIHYVFLDLNMLIFLDRYIHGHVFEDSTKFVKLMNVIKNKAQIFVDTAILESMSKNKNNCRALLISYYKFLNAKELNQFTQDIKLTQSQYDEIDKKIIEAQQLVKDNGILQKFSILQCMVLKSFIIRFQKNPKISKKQRFDELFKYCLRDLCIFDPTELYALAQFFNESNQNYFSKLQPSKKDIVNVSSNIAWDLFHPRLAKEAISYQINFDSPKFPIIYFATNDQELKNYILLNPLRDIIFQKGYAPTNVSTYNAHDICGLLNNKKLFNEILDFKNERKSWINKLNFLSIKNDLEEQAQNILDEYK